MKKVLLFVSLLGALCLTACAGKNSQSADNAEEPKPVRYEYGLPIDSFQVTTNSVQNGETLGGILNRLGAKPSTIREVTFMKSPLFNPRDIRPKKEYEAWYGELPIDSLTVDTALCYFIYHKNLTNSIILDVRDSLRVSEFVRPLDTLSRESHITIQSSLWNACYDADANPQLALELSDIYAWTVDFFAIQENDQFIAIYDETRVDSTFVGIPRIHAAAYISRGDTLRAYYYKYGEKEGYFDEQGKNLRKTFLKAPLNFKRISSGFTYARKHPIYKTVRPHTGVDYAAPKGTPVVALGDGVVTFKAYKGGGGNTIKIKHNSTYTTGYLHLNGYAKGLAVGKRVKQGEVIGYVGSTGASTGPHLDFRVWKNGTPINPLTMKSPSADPIPASEMEAFKMHIKQFTL